MTFRAVCDAWIDEIRGEVTGLGDATIHRYSSWSDNAIQDTTPGLHLAVWPEVEPDVVERLTTDGSDQITTAYVIQVWEKATAETERVFDDDASAGAWVDLYEAVMQRLYVRSNLSIGDPGSTTRYAGGGFMREGDLRAFAIRFTKTRYQQALP